MTQEKPPAPTVEGLRDNWTKLFDALDGDSDFVCVMIVGTSYVDYALGALLKAHFLDVTTSETLLQPTGGNLGSLHIKSSLTYCLGLISKGCKANIDRIAEVRNQFAHRLGELNFSDPKIAELCQQIKLPSPNEHVKTTSDDPSLLEIISSPRKRFEFVVCIMCTTLWASARNVRKCTPLIENQTCSCIKTRALLVIHQSDRATDLRQFLSLFLIVSQHEHPRGGMRKPFVWVFRSIHRPQIVSA